MTAIAELDTPPVPSRDVPKPSHTPLRNVRVEGQIWKPARRISVLRRELLSDVIRDALRRYVARHKSLLADDPEWLKMVADGEVEPL